MVAKTSPPGDRSPDVHDRKTTPTAIRDDAWIGGDRNGPRNRQELSRLLEALLSSLRGCDRTFGESVAGPEGGLAGWTPMPDIVLVVDDNPAFRDLARRILTAWGHEVVEAGSVAEALVCAAATRPAAALVDIGLPDGDGFNLTQQLIGLPWPIRVILTSTDSDAGNGFAAERVGASGFFPKDELLSADLRQLMAGA